MKDAKFGSKIDGTQYEAQDDRVIGALVDVQDKRVDCTTDSIQEGMKYGKDDDKVDGIQYKALDAKVIGSLDGMQDGRLAGIVDYRGLLVGVQLGSVDGKLDDVGSDV